MLLDAVGPGHCQAPGFAFAAQSEKKAAVVRRQIGTASLSKACQGPFANPQFYFGPHNIGMVLAKKLYAQPMASRAADAAQHCRRLVHVADDQVDTAVVVEVAAGHTAAQVSVASVTSQAPADVAELAAAVAVQKRRLLA